MAHRPIPIVLLLLACSAAAPAGAQERAPCVAAVAAADTAAARPDLVIRASARVDELRFQSRPEVAVRLAGCAVPDTVRVLERRNLPDPVQPGVAYRDVYVAVEILGHLEVRCLLPELAAALRPCRPTGADPAAAPGPRR